MNISVYTIILPVHRLYSGIDIKIEYLTNISILFFFYLERFVNKLDNVIVTFDDGFMSAFCGKECQDITIDLFASILKFY
jgi:hypothetical protein